MLEKINPLLPVTTQFLDDSYADQIFGKLYSTIQQQHRALIALKARCVNKTVTIYDMVPFDLVGIKCDEARLGENYSSNGSIDMN